MEKIHAQNETRTKNEKIKGVEILCKNIREVLEGVEREAGLTPLEFEPERAVIIFSGISTRYSGGGDISRIPIIYDSPR